MKTPSLAEMFKRLVRAESQSRAAKTVELFGWLILLESPVLLLAPNWGMALLHMPTLVEQAENAFRLIGLLIGGLGMLYVIAGRLNATGFVFGSLLDRPLVPPVMLVLWYLGIVPGALAMIFAIQDGGSFLWTLSAWRADRRAE